MALDISTNGDILEQTYIDVINEKLPAYRKIWECYIGNDGKARTLALSNLSAKEERDRQIFAQYHYSCFESVVAMRIIKDKIDAFKILSVQDYIQANNDFLAYQAHAGRIRDGVGRLGTLCGLRNLDAELNEYYQQRNEVLHGCKIPFMLIEGVLAIPKIKGCEEDQSAWRSEKTWSEVDENDCDFLSTYLSDTYEGIANALNNALFKIYEYIVSVIKGHESNLESPRIGVVSTFTPTVSGLVNNHVFIDTPFIVSGSVK